MHKLMASILLKQRAKYSFISHASYLISLTVAECPLQVCKVLLCFSLLQRLSVGRVTPWHGWGTEVEAGAAYRTFWKIAAGVGRSYSCHAQDSWAGARMMEGSPVPQCGWGSNLLPCEWKEWQGGVCEEVGRALWVTCFAFQSLVGPSLERIVLWPCTLLFVSPALVPRWGPRFAAGFAVGGVFWWSWLHLLRGQPALEGPRVRFLQNQGVKSQGNLQETATMTCLWWMRRQSLRLTYFR